MGGNSPRQRVLKRDSAGVTVCSHVCVCLRRVQEGPSGDQEEVFRHSEAAEEGEERFVIWNNKHTQNRETERFSLSQS